VRGHASDSQDSSQIGASQKVPTARDHEVQASACDLVCSDNTHTSRLLRGNFMRAQAQSNNARLQDTQEEEIPCPLINRGEAQSC
jgi:hypothetical protein